MVRYVRTGEFREPRNEYHEDASGKPYYGTLWVPAWILRRVEEPEPARERYHCPTCSRIAAPSIDHPGEQWCSFCGQHFTEPGPGWGPLAVKQNEELKAKAPPARPTTGEVVACIELSTLAPQAKAEAIRRVRVHDDARERVASAQALWPGFRHAAGELLAILDGAGETP